MTQRGCPFVGTLMNAAAWSSALLLLEITDAADDPESITSFPAFGALFGWSEVKLAMPMAELG